jgi:tetratricopeptide (TPR) repeat protein
MRMRRLRSWTMCLLISTGWLPVLGVADPALAQSFRVYVNNKAVVAGEAIEVPPESAVTFSVRLLTGRPPVTIDPTGGGELVQTLSGQGPVFDLTTRYQAGTYEPRIAVGTDLQRFKLIVGQASTSLTGILTRAAGLAATLFTWPVVTLIALIVLAPTLYRLIPRLRAIKVGETELLIGDLEASIQNAIDSTIRTLERVFPPGKADKFMPTSAPDLDYYVHVAEFLDSIGVPIKSTAVWNAVGAYYFIRDEEKSRRLFERSITLDPQDHAAYTTLGMWHLRLKGDVYAAKSLFLKSVELAGAKGRDCPWAHVGLSAIGRNIGDPATHTSERELARDQFQRALSEDPTDFWALHGLGWCSFHEGNLLRALSEMQRALSLKGDFDAVRYNLACVLARLSRPADAVATLRQIVEMEAKAKLERLGVPTEQDFTILKADPAFTGFLGAIGLVYQL